MKKDALETLGKILDKDSEETRDAVHVACLPAIAKEPLDPSERVGYRDGYADKSYEHIGIVDPFLDEMVWTGEKFWILLFPRTITGLRHLWTHPNPYLQDLGNTDVSAKEKAKAYLYEVANETIGITLDEFLAGLDGWVQSGTVPCIFGDEPNTRSVLPDLDKLWEAYRVYKDFDGEIKDEEVYWSCSC